MKERHFVGIILLVVCIIVANGCSLSNYFNPNDSPVVEKNNQDSTYQIDFPMLGEHTPEITSLTFSSGIDFSKLTQPIPVYEVSKKMYSEYGLKILGEGFGFDIDGLQKNDYSYDWYVEPGHFLTIVSEGTFIYQNYTEDIDPAKPFPDDKTLRATAEKFLTDINLPLDGSVFNNVSDGLVLESGSGESFVEQRTVSFMRYIDGLPVYGNSRLTVSLDRELNIAGVDSVHSPVIAQAYTPQVRDAKDMLAKAIELGRGLQAFDLQKDSDKVSLVVTEICHAYWEDIDTNYVFPVFHYSGEVYNVRGECIGKFIGIEQSF
jgi:hypothetical protein